MLDHVTYQIISVNKRLDNDDEIRTIKEKGLDAVCNRKQLSKLSHIFGIDNREISKNKITAKFQEIKEQVKNNSSLEFVMR